MKWILMLILTASLSSCRYNYEEKNPLIGTDLPSFSLLLSDSSEHLMTKDIPAGKPIVFILISPHCPYSQSQIKELTQNIDKLKDSRLFVVTPFSYNEMKIFCNSFNLTKYPQIITGIDEANYYSRYIQAAGVPCITFYNSQKKLLKIILGKISIEDINSYI